MIKREKATGVVPGITHGIKRTTNKFLEEAQMIPRGDLILVRKIKEDKLTKGGIVLPDKVSHAFTHAEVLAKGKGHYLENGERATIDDLNVGDIVLCGSEKGLPLIVEGDRDMMVINQADVVAVDDGRTELNIIETQEK